MGRVMEVKIEQKEETLNFMGKEVYTGFFGGVKTREVPKTATYHFVYLFLSLTEEEKAVIRINNLDEIVLDIEYSDIEPFSPDEEAAIATEPSMREILEDVHRQIAKDGTPYTVEEFTSNTFNRAFDTPREANIYSKKLKEVILPKLKALIEESSQAGPRSETFTL